MPTETHRPRSGVTAPTPQRVTGRIPPQNLDAEISTLGALLLDNEAIMKVADTLNPEDFYRPDHGQVYSAMLGLFEKRTPIDLVTVAGELERIKALDDIGGMAKLSSLVSSVATAANVSHYATIVREKALLRRLIGAASTIGELGFQEELEVDELLDNAERTLFGVTQRFLKQNFISVRSILDDSFERLGMLAKGDGALRGTPTGFRQLDRLLGGLQRSDLLIIAARPSMGKTAFALNIAEYVAIQEKKVVGVFSLEMSKEQLVDRLISSIGRVDSWKLRNGQLSEDDMSNLIQAQAQLAEAELFIDDAPMASVMEVRAKARRLQAEHGLDLIVIDYLQLMQGSIRHQDNRVQEVSEISRSLKALAKELNCPVIALSQLSRAVEARNDKRPMLSDLRESGCLRASTLITRADTGERVTIKSLVGQANIPVWSLDFSGHVVPALISKVFSSGRKKTFNLRLRSGRSIVASGNHPFRLYNRWQALDGLRPGQRVAVPRALPIIHEDFAPYTEGHLVLFAHMLGDGCYVEHQPIHYTSADPLNIQAVWQAARDTFGITGRVVDQKTWQHVYLPSPERLGKGKHHPFMSWLNAEGLGFAHSWDKRLPENLFRCSERQIRLFLHHLWATDGSITHANGRVRIYYASTSKELLHQIQSLMLRLGIQSVVKEVQTKRVQRPGYTLDILGGNNALSFLEQVGCFGARGLQIPGCINQLVGTRRNPNVDGFDASVWQDVIDPIRQRKGVSWRGLSSALHMAYSGSSMMKSGLSQERLTRVATALQSRELHDLALGNIYWDEIVGIDELGEEEVFDATVPGTHAFVANDIIVHNSIEQDADVVMFLYRDDYYNKAREEHNNMLEVIISKHRNGPTGDVKLSAQLQHSRFYDIDLRNESN